MARSSLRPVRELSAAVEHVTATEELAPIDDTGSRDDHRLGGVVQRDAPIARLLPRSPARLIADAGHELRTPLTSLRTNIELLAADAQSGLLNAA